LSRESGGRALGPQALLAMADRAWSIATVQGIADEQELLDVQVDVQICEFGCLCVVCVALAVPDHRMTRCVCVCVCVNRSPNDCL
jgi:hypothetical protein